MERRKLFSDVAVTTRRKLFSDVSATTRRKLFSSEAECECTCDEKVVMVCQDCGYNLETTATTCEEICPNCGSKRFNHKCEISTPLEDVEVPEVKTYSRRKLFSSLTEIQPNTEGAGSAVNFGNSENLYQCQDCKHEFVDPSETPSGTRCPNCGGNRVLRSKSEYAGQCEVSDKTDEFLKTYSGQTVDYDVLQKTFSDDEIGSMITEGYAIEDENGGLYFSEVAYSQKKLFSELVISVTKELGLEPVNSKEGLISKLLESGNLPDKSIILIKRAHNVVPSVDSHEENYLQDSGIKRDLRLMHGGESMGIREFLKFLDEQYNDAPEDILDKLVSDNVIKISGSQVEILK